MSAIGRRLSLAPADASQQCPRVLYGVSITIVVEICPDTSRAALPDFFRPAVQFCRRIIVSIPLAHTMEPDVDFFRRLDQPIRQARAATGAENDTVRLKSGENALVPPASMPKFDDVAPGRVELSSDAIQPRATEMKARWQLKQKAADVSTEEVGNMAKVADEFLRSDETFDVSDQLGNFDRINKFPSSHLPPPIADGGRSGPGIKGSVEFHRSKMIRVMGEPIG